ncbi:pitrilysin family protein [Pelomonas sp. KK5]|uniref:M16 family metallopeptidase n=1 Tax=Pelomonas sp. KK5 TaxID=1855730 RepID=UPI00097C2F0A|nr:pitrilysin family protein [Pelomonas sp. KK5]
MLKPTLLVLALAASFAAQAAPTRVREVEGITEYRLPNGLQILLAPDESKPTTTVNVTYRVGSRQENYGETGMAHLLEHLLFKGSTHFPDPKADFTRRGFSWNGSTWFDRTNYFAAFSAGDENLKSYLAWQADAMVNSFIARKDLDTEMTVVRNEMEMGENDPENVASQRALGAMYLWHNYGKDTIGARSDVEHVSIPRLQAFYRRYYQPDNATLIVSGKFEPARALAWIEQSFGRIPKPTRTLEKTYTQDPVQDGENLVTVRRVGGNPLSVAAYHVPAGPTPDYAAVELLNGILTNQPDGRLYRRLVIEDKLAAEVSPFSLALAEPGFAMFVAKLAPGAAQERLNAALLSTVEGLGREPVTDEELARARTRWLNRWEKQFTNPEQVGIALSESISQGDWRLYFLLRDRIKAMALADVQRVATQYLRPGNRTLAQYIPTDKPERAPAPAFADLQAELATFKPQAAAAAVARFEATPANIDKATLRSELPGGMQLALLPKATRGGAVQGVFTIRLGTAESLQGQAATAELAGAMLKMGTRTLSRSQLRDALDAAKVQLAVQATATGLSLTWSTTREHAAEALALIGRMLREPRFEAAGLEEVRAAALAQLQEQREDPMALAPNEVDVALDMVPRGHPRYKPTFAEREQDLKAVTLDGVQGFQQRFYGSSQSWLALVGDFDAEAIKAAAGRALASWAAPVAPVRVADVTVDKPGRLQLLPTPEKQNAMMFGVLPLALSDDTPDAAALTVANQIFGGGAGSRLWARLREKDGLSYGAGTGLSLNPQDPRSGWYVYAIFAPAVRAKVEAGLREEAARLLAGGVTPKEVADARGALLSEARLGLAQDAQLAAALARQAMLGRTMARTQKELDAIAAVTPEQVNAALRKYLKLDGYQLVFAGDFR